MTPTAETLLADLDCTLSASVDRRGVIRLRGTPWLVDCMIGTEDGWRPLGELGALRRRLLDLTPVVETTARVGGGEIVHRVFVASDRAGTPAVTVEVRNDSSDAVGVAFVVRSTDDEPAAVAWASRDEAEATVDFGRWSAVLPMPARAVVSRGGIAGGDDLPALLAASADAPRVGSGSTTGPDGGSVAVAFVRPLAHTLTTRLAVSDRGAVSPTAIADADAVARGWSRHVSGGARIELPEPVLADLAAASRARVVTGARADEIERATDPGLVDAVADVTLVDALVVMGHARLAAGLGARLLTSLDRRGLVRVGTGSSVAATGAALRILGLCATDLDRSEVEAWLPEVAGMLEALDRAERRQGGDLTGFERAWVQLGRRGAVDVLVAVGQHDASAAVGALLAGDEPEPPPPVDPDRSGWARMIGARARVRAGHWPDEEMRWLAERSSATGLIPLGTDDHLVAAETVSLWRDLAVVRDAPSGVLLLPVVRDRWLGQPLEAHDVPVGGGSIGFAVRWHGSRPALLWESDGLEGSTIRCPGLDPVWSTDAPSGEALLAGPPPPDSGQPEATGGSPESGPTEGGSFS